MLHHGPTQPRPPHAASPHRQVAKALVEFEALWHQAWLRGIEQQRAGLGAPLLVRHPDSGQLLVNLDRDVMTLIR